jgi:hypothetical protein
MYWERVGMVSVLYVACVCVCVFLCVVGQQSLVVDMIYQHTTKSVFTRNDRCNIRWVGRARDADAPCL